MLLELSNDLRDPVLAKRASVILECGKGHNNKEVSAITGMNVMNIAHWRKAYAINGIEALRGDTNHGRNQYSSAEDSLDTRLDELLSQESQQWTVDQLVQELHSTRARVYAALKRKNINLQRTRQWVIPTRDELVPKTVDIVGLYMTKAEQGMVVCCCHEPITRLQGKLITRNRLLYEDFAAYKGPVSLCDAIRTASSRINDTTRQTPLYLSDFLDQALDALPRQNSMEYHVVICSSKMTAYRGRWINKLYLTWTDSPAQWLQSVEQKINELGDRNQDNVPHNLRDALRLYVENCKESTNPLTWYKTPDPEDDSAESLQQEEVADAEGVSSSEPVFDGTEHSPLLDDLRQVLKSHFVTDELKNDSIRSGFISFAMDRDEVRIQIDTDQGNEIEPSCLRMDSIEDSASCISVIEDKILEIRNRAGVHAAEITADLVKKNWL